MLKCVSWSYDAYFYYYFKDENNNCYFWKTKSAKLNNACYNNGQFLKPFEVIRWSIKESNREIKSYNDEQYSEIIVEELKLINYFILEMIVQWLEWRCIYDVSE